MRLQNATIPRLQLLKLGRQFYDFTLFALVQPSVLGNLFVLQGHEGLEMGRGLVLLFSKIDFGFLKLGRTRRQTW